MNYSIVKHKTNFKIDHSIIGSFDSSTLLPNTYSQLRTMD